MVKPPARLIYLVLLLAAVGGWIVEFASAWVCAAHGHRMGP
jgi:hypothetical protein